MVHISGSQFVMIYRQKSHNLLTICYQQRQVRFSVQIKFRVEKCKLKVMAYEITFEQKPTKSFEVY